MNLFKRISIRLIIKDINKNRPIDTPLFVVFSTGNTSVTVYYLLNKIKIVVFNINGSGVKGKLVSEDYEDLRGYLLRMLK